MELAGKKILSKLKDKNRGNTQLVNSLNQLQSDLENTNSASFEHLKKLRNDIEKVHNQGFYFVDIHIHRAMLFIKIKENEATIVWAGSHQEYVRLFKNNKDSIEKWLKKNNFLK
jgi:hypothetical protein